MHFRWRGDLDLAAEGAVVGAVLAVDDVEVVGLEVLAEFDVDGPLVLGEELLPAELPRIWRGIFLVDVELRLLGSQLGIDREVRADEAAIFRPPHGRVLEPQLE